MTLAIFFVLFSSPPQSNKQLWSDLDEMLRLDINLAKAGIPYHLQLLCSTWLFSREMNREL